MSSVPISTVYVERIRTCATIAGSKMESATNRGELAEPESNHGVMQNQPHFNRLADVQMMWQATTKKLFWFTS